MKNWDDNAEGFQRIKQKGTGSGKRFDSKGKHVSKPKDFKHRRKQNQKMT